MDEKKLWPVEQLLERLDSVNTKFLTIKPKHLWLLICLLKFAHNKTLTCCPSFTRLANISGLPLRTVYYYIKELENVGILIRKFRLTKKGDPDSNEYKIDPNKLWKTGAYCPYPLRNSHYPPASTALPPCEIRTLTTNTTTNLTKKQEPKMIEEKPRSKYTQPSGNGFVERNTASDEFKNFDESKKTGMPEELRKKYKMGDKVKEKENSHERSRL